MSKWQPIETAPRIHGKRVLLCKDGGPGSLPSISIGYAFDSILGWCSDECSDECYGFKTLEDYGYRATHWMPLPEPPEGT